MEENETLEHYIKIREETINFTLTKKDINTIIELINLCISIPNKFIDINKKIDVMNLQIEIFRKCRNFTDEDIEKLTGYKPQKIKEILSSIDESNIQELKEKQQIK